jgi:hypothetical protein
LYSALSGGTIPDAIGDLTALTYLDLRGNELSGTIPDVIGGLTALTSLSLGSNELSGTIPDAIGGLTALTELGLNSNKLTGAGAGICSIVGNSWSSQTYGGCHLSPNSAWTDGATCPTCLNTGACAPPVTCTGALTITPTSAPTTTAPTSAPTTTAPSSAPTISAPASASDTAARSSGFTAVIVIACIAIGVLITAFVATPIVLVVIYVIWKKQQPAAVVVVDVEMAATPPDVNITVTV